MNPSINDAVSRLNDRCESIATGQKRCEVGPQSLRVEPVKRKYGPPITLRVARMMLKTHFHRSSPAEYGRMSLFDSGGALISGLSQVFDRYTTLSCDSITFFHSSQSFSVISRVLAQYYNRLAEIMVSLCHRAANGRWISVCAKSVL